MNTHAIYEMDLYDILMAFL